MDVTYLLGGLLGRFWACAHALAGFPPEAKRKFTWLKHKILLRPTIVNSCAHRLGSRTGPQERRKEGLKKKGEGFRQGARGGFRGGGGGGAQGGLRGGPCRFQNTQNPCISEHPAVGRQAGPPTGGGGGCVTKFCMWGRGETESGFACFRRFSAGSRGEFLRNVPINIIHNTLE